MANKLIISQRASISAQYSGPDYDANQISLVNTNIVPTILRGTTRFEFHVYDKVGSSPINSNYQWLNFNNLSNDSTISSIEVDPRKDIEEMDMLLSFQNFTLVYNFFNTLCGTNETRQLIIDSISSDRTELILKGIFTNNTDFTNNTQDYINYREAAPDFRDFYLNLGDNTLLLGTNIQIDTTDFNNPLIFIKLYEPLPDSIQRLQKLWIVQKIAETLVYDGEYLFDPIVDDSIQYLSGPNINISLGDEVNSSTEFLTRDELLPTGSFYLNQINTLISSSGLNINVDYNDYNNFINYSSPTIRLQNFYYKLSLLEEYQSELNSLVGVDNNSGSINLYQSRIDEIIQNFDGYDKFLYYESGSKSWPKTNSTYPYTLASTSSVEAQEWYGSLNTTSIYYGGQLLSASNFDENNRNYLLYSIPSYLRDDPQNAPYETFVSMIGQHFDNIWIYTKDITNKFNGDNRINFGISRDLVSDAIKEFGIKLYQNNFSNSELIRSFFGTTTDYSVSDALFYGVGTWGGFLYAVPGEEIILTSISASNDIIPIDDINKRIYKRIYHNSPFLLKSKGTKRGLQALINCFGVPDSILQINEFGGKDKVRENDWDFYRRIYNKELISTGSTNQYTTFFANKGTPDTGLNSDWGVDPNVPRTVEFRFKSRTNPDTLPNCIGLTNTPIREELFILKDTDDTNTNNSSSLAITLEYFGSGSVTSSYSGSSFDPNNQYADLTLYVSGSTQYYSSSINLPFYNRDWWNVMLQYDSGSNKFNLYTGNKIYIGNDGTKLGFTGSTSITVPAYVDTLGYRNANLANTGFARPNSFFGTGKSGSLNFSGSFQEHRYWTNLLSVKAFHNHVMNPLSIETGYLTGSLSPVETLAFRTREGEDWSLTGSATLTKYLSIHPKVTGSLTPTSSFTSTGTGSNEYDITGVYEGNKEFQFLNQPIAGIKNRINDKIRVENLEFPEGNTLTYYRPLQQNNEASQSFTDHTNYIEVGFSPSNQVNDDIIAQLGQLNIGEYIGDPRHRSSSLDYYEDLNNLRDEYFEKYVKNYDVNDFIRLIKYFDNSLFKMIKDFIPLRNSTSTGIIIKQHLLERNKYPEPRLNPRTKLAKKPSLVVDQSLTGSFELGLNGEFGTNTSIDPLVLINGVSSSIGTKDYDGIVSEVNAPFSSPIISGSVVSNISTIGLDINFGDHATTPTQNTAFYLVSSDGDPAQSRLKYDIFGNPTTLGSLYGQPLQNLSTNFTISTIPGEIIAPVIFTGQGTFESFSITGSVFNASTLVDNQEIIFDNITITGSVKSQPKGFSSGSSIEQFSGGTGGSLELFNGINFHPYGVSGSGPENRFGITQSFSESVNYLTGSIITLFDDQSEFYNGEFSGSAITVTTQSLNLGEKSFNFNNGLQPVNFGLRKYIFDADICEEGTYVPPSNTPINGEIFLFVRSNRPTRMRIARFSQSVDITGNLEGKTRFNFLNTTTGATFSENVTQVGITPEYIDYEINFPPQNPADVFDLTTSVFYNYEASGSNTPHFENTYKIDAGGQPFGTFGYRPTTPPPPNQGLLTDIQSEVPLGRPKLELATTFGTETDPYNLLDNPNNGYLSPGLSNKDIFISSSFSGSFNIINTTNNPIGLVFGAFTMLRSPQGVDIPLNFKGLGRLTVSGSSFISGSIFDLDWGLNSGISLDNNFELNNTLPRTISSFFTGPNLPQNNLYQGSRIVTEFRLRYFQLGTVQGGQYTPYTSGSLIFSGSFTDYMINVSSSTDLINTLPNVHVLNTEPITGVSNLNQLEREADALPLFNNVTEGQKNTKYFEVDGTQGGLTPVNFIPILNQSAVKASIPDSNYSQLTRILPRYNGVKLQSLRPNVYTPPNFYYLDNGNLRRWDGDISFGERPVLELTKPNFTYFDLLVGTSPEMEDATQVKINYIIDKNANALKPLDGTPAFFNVERTYETNDVVSIFLQNSLQQDDQSLTNASVGINLDAFNTASRVIRGARRIDPICTNQIVSIKDVVNTNDAFSDTIFFGNTLNESIDYRYLGTDASSSYGAAGQALDGVFAHVPGGEIVKFRTAITDNNNSYDFQTNEYVVGNQPVDGNNFIFKTKGTMLIELLGSPANPNQPNGVYPTANQMPIPFIPNVVTLRILRDSTELGTTNEILGEGSFDFNFIGGANPIFDANIFSQPTEVFLGDKIRLEIEVAGPTTIINPVTGIPFYFTAKLLRPSNASPFLPFTFEVLPESTNFTSVNIDSGSFWTTGSAFDSYVTSSPSMSRFFGVVPYEQPPGSTFKPTNEIFTIKIGDQFRFQGSENEVFTVIETPTIGSGPGVEDCILVKLDPPVRPLMNINNFLIRRFNPDGGSVILDLKPPSSSFSTTAGYMKSTFIDLELEQNINNILADLVDRGVIPTGQ